MKNLLRQATLLLALISVIMIGCTTVPQVSPKLYGSSISKKQAIKIALDYLLKTEPNVEIFPHSATAIYRNTGSLGWDVYFDAVPKSEYLDGKHIYHCGPMRMGVRVSPDGSDARSIVGARW